MKNNTIAWTNKLTKNETDHNIRAKDQDKLVDFVYLSILYDFYGELLGEYKSKIFEDYILNDLSLSEIADEAGISRQGVHDIVKRCSIKLREYEDTLHLVKKFEQTKLKVNEIMGLSIELKEKQVLDNINSTYAIVADKIIKISKEILNEL